MLKWLKFFLAILLLPVCAATAQTLWRVLVAGSGADLVWVPMLGGAACWIIVFLLLPKPMLIYVFGHEFTHALWTWLFGGEVKKMKVTAKGGHVLISKTNFLIVLAPYFFPLYALLVVGAFGLGNWIWGWHHYAVWFHLALGAAYAFHVTLTVHVLQSEQSDITSQGYLFSAVMIFLGNAGLLLLGIPVLTARISLWQTLTWWWKSLLGIVRELHHWI